MKNEFIGIIKDLWNNLLLFLKTPVWAVITAVCIGLAGWMTFEFINNIGVAGIDFDLIGGSAVFVFLFQCIFTIIPKESFLGFFAEGPLLLPFVFSGLIFIIYRIIDNSVSKKVPVLGVLEKAARLKGLISFFIFEFMITAVFTAAFFAAGIILLFAANVALGWGLVHGMISLLFTAPIFQLIILLLKQLTKSRIVIFSVSFVLFGVFFVLEPVSYFADQQGVIGMFSTIHLFLQWISPLHYSVSGVVSNSFPGFMVNLGLLLVLGAGIGFGGLLVSNRKGVQS